MIFLGFLSDAKDFISIKRVSLVPISTNSDFNLFELSSFISNYKIIISTEISKRIILLIEVLGL